MLKIFVIEDTSIWPSFISGLKNKRKCNLHYIAHDDVTDFEICGFTETQKTRYLENEAFFFLQIKELINYTSRATLHQKIVS